MNENEILEKARLYFEKAYELCKPCEWFETDDDCEVKYMTGNTRFYWSLLCCGLAETLMKRDHGIYERDRLQGNTKNYYKLFYKNGRLIKVEDYIDGRLRGYFLSFYNGNVRVLKPFDTDKICHWLHLGIVSEFSEEGVVNEVLIDENGQVINSEYRYKTNIVEYETANCLPNAKCDRIQAFEQGVFYDNGKKYKKLS